MDRELLRHSIAEHVRLGFARSGGAGGQNVNKVNTKVHMSLPLAAITGLTEEERLRLYERLRPQLNKDGCLFLDVQDERSQERNRAIALERLESKIVQAASPLKKRVKTKPTRASRERRLRTKKLRSGIKRLRMKSFQES